MKFSDFIIKSAVVKELKAGDKKGVIKELAETIKSAYNPEGFKINEVVDLLMKREKIGSTGIGNGVAVPHAKMDGLKSVLGALGRSSRGVDFNAIDGETVHLAFLILAPSNNTEANLQTLQRVSQAIKRANFCKFLREAKDTKDIMELFAEVDEALTLK